MPCEVLAVDAVAADLERVGRGGDRAGVGGGGDLGAVDVQTQGGAVVGLGEVASRCWPTGRRCRKRRRSCRRRSAGVGPGAVAGGAFEVVVVVALVDHVAPVGVDGRGVDPGFERQPAGEVQRGGVRDRDQRGGAVEGERLAVLAGGRPGRVRDRPVVPVARLIGDRRPRPLIKPNAATSPAGAADAGRDGASETNEATSAMSSSALVAPHTPIARSGAGPPWTFIPIRMAGASRSCNRAAASRLPVSAQRLPACLVP